MKNIYLIILGIFFISSTLPAQPIGRATRKMSYYNYTRAIEILQKSVEKQRYYKQSVPLLAECYYQQHNPEQSALWYEKAVSIDPSNVTWTERYARSLEMTGDYTRALEIWKKLAALKPSDKIVQARMKQCEVLLTDWQLRPALFEVKKVANVNSPASDFGPCFYANGFVFTSDRGKDLMENENYGWTGRPYLKIMFTKPLEPGDFFGELRQPEMMGNVFNQSFHDGPVTFAGDSIAYFTRTLKEKEARKSGNIRTNQLKIYKAERIRGEWQKPVPSSLNSYDYSVGHPALGNDGKTLYFASDMPGGLGGVDLWKCSYDGKSWSKPVNLGPAINTPGNEMFPTIRSDGALFFASDGLPGYGGLDIFCAEPAGNGFLAPYNVMAPVNSSFDDFSMAWFPGTNYGMFSSDRPGGKGLDDIYAFKKLPCKVETEKKLLPAVIKGIVRDKTTRSPLEGATVFVLNEMNDSVYVLKTNAQGEYSLEIPYSTGLIVKAARQQYIPDCFSWKKEALEEGKDNLAPRDLFLEKLEIRKPITLKNIFYDFDKYDIRPDAEPALDELVNIMKQNPVTIELSSHTDCRGSFAYNDKLSEQRAKSAVDYIVKNGIDASRITSKGYGEHQLVNKCSDGVKCTEDEHQANRRTEFKVLSWTTPLQTDKPAFNPDDFGAGQLIYREALPADFFMQCR